VTTQDSEQTGIFRLLVWNVEGLLTKIYDPDFVRSLQKFSFVCLTETFLEYFDNANFLVNFDCFVSPARKLSAQGRRSGGVICFIRKCYACHFQIVECAYENIIVFRVSQKFFGMEKDILLLCTYVPPFGSPFYASKDSSDGIELLERCMLDLEDKYKNCLFILCGDFNARTGELNTNCDVDLQDVLSEPYGKSRTSKDVTLNSFGVSLLSLCLSFDLTILNGTVSGDTCGNFTYLSVHGDSVVDYVVVSRSILSSCKHLYITENTLSSHMCVQLELLTSYYSNVENSDFITVQSKLTWDENSVACYVKNLVSNMDYIGLNSFLTDESINVDHTTNTLTACLNDAVRFMRNSFVIRTSTRHKSPWFDKECWSAKRKLSKLLHKRLRTRKPKDKIEYAVFRKYYKQLITKKRKEYNADSISSLQTSLKDSKQFWGKIRRLNYGKKQQNNITKSEWYTHFTTLFDSNRGTYMESIEATPPMQEDPAFDTSDLNAAITTDEVSHALRKLKNGKSAGPDQVVGEMLKYASHILMPYLCKLFNAVFETGVYPLSWTKSVIVPLHKKGCVNDPNNFRGISLTSILGKAFTSILNNRLQQWAEINELIPEEQGGFRRGYSTVDNIYTLHSIVQQYLYRKKKLFVAFIDFQKAFDTIDRQSLWMALRNNGINGRMLTVLKAMYISVASCVRCANGYTDFFECPKGLKQGCNLSPQLFSYLSCEIMKAIKREGKHGVQLMPDLTEVFMLLFADDMVLVSDTVLGLQNQLNILSRKADDLGLKVNLDKSKIVVFRLGGHLAEHEKWYLGNNRLVVVNEYKYLGMVFSTKLSTNVTLRDLAIRAKSAVINIIKTMRRINCTSCCIFFKLFDTQVQPILLYASEIWGLEGCDIIEGVHLFAIKRFLNVSMQTPNALVYCETGRFPLSINCTLRAVKYWMKILRMPDSRFPRKVYNMMKARGGRLNNWYQRLKSNLSEHGFQHICTSETIANESEFLRCLRQKLIDCFDQILYERMTNSTRYALYRLIKPERSMERYLQILDKQVIRDLVIRFRVGTSEINAHRNRFSKGADDICPACYEDDEDDIHFMLQCPVYEDLRLKYLQLSGKRRDQSTFVYLFTSTDDTVIRALGMYILYAFKRRRTAQFIT